MELNQKNKEVGLRELILNMIEWRRYIQARWKIILIAGLIGGGLGYLRATFKEKVYTGELTFALEDKSSSLNAYSGIASQFGFDLGKGEGGPFSGDNILELIKSRLIIENTLLSEVKINGKNELLINHYITHNKLDEAWKANEIFAGLKYTAGQPRETFTRQQDSVMNGIGEGIKGGLVVDRVEKKLTIISVKYSSDDELFAKYFTEVLCRNVSEFYIDTKTKKIRANILLLQDQVDSVKMALDNEMYGAALSQDQNQNTVRAQVRVPLAKRQMNIQLLTTMYGELFKNLELSKLTLMKEEPLIQVIDHPILPLKYKKPGRLISLILGGLIGGFIVIASLMSYRLYQEVMRDGTADKKKGNTA